MDPLNKINPFNPAMQGVGATGGSKAINPGSLTGGGSAAGGSGLFSQKTSGINEKMNDQPVFTASSVGKKAGISGGNLNLIA